MLSMITTDCLDTEHNTVGLLQTLPNKENAKMQMAMLATTVSPTEFRTIMASAAQTSREVPLVTLALAAIAEDAG